MKQSKIIDTTETYQSPIPVQIARGNLHNLIGDPDACPELYTTMIELRDTTEILGRQSIHEEQYLGY